MVQRMKDLDLYLELGTNDVRMIGIKGVGGAGKTILAWAIYNKISFNFEGKSFVENVREKASQIGGLEKLQEQVLTDVLNKHINVRGVHEGRNLMSKNLSGKKVLVVLDDVDAINQLEMLAGDTTCFKPGSRIIITTRDGQVLEEHKVWIRDANLLLEEFSRHAFGEDIPTQGYEKYAREVVSYTGGLPLTIKVLGSKLYGKDNSEWAYTLERLKTIHLKETLRKLELGYESLDDHHKDIFLDVACFLRGWKKEDAIRVLESCGFHAKYGLRVLEQKSLIVTLKRNSGALIDMHDHLVEMGKNIVRREHPHEPNKHSRLWIQKEVKHVLARNSGSEVTRCITHGNFLKGLGNMKKLRCLIVNHDNQDIYHDPVDHQWYFFGKFWKHYTTQMYFPNSLQYVYWFKDPNRCLPKSFEANNLVALEMSYSKIKQLWEGEKVMKKLRFLDLNYSKKLRSLDLRLTPNLERLHLEGCDNLVELYCGYLKSLVYLNLCQCNKLGSLDLGLTPNLESLNLLYCYNLVKLNVHGGCLKSLVCLWLYKCESLESISFLEQLESLKVLNIGGSNLREVPDYIFRGHSNNSLFELDFSDHEMEEIPSSIGNLHKLVSLRLDHCNSLKSLPGSICSLQHLRTLTLFYARIEELPEDLGQLECLESLYLSFTKVKHLPSSICMLKHLKNLSLEYCDDLEKLPEDVGQLESLKRLLLRFSGLREIPNSICKLKCLRELDLDSCWGLEKLPDQLGDLKCLQLLSVWDTRITHLPHSIYSVKGLEIRKRKPMNCCDDVYPE